MPAHFTIGSIREVLYQVHRGVKFMETESRIAITRGWGRVELGVLLMGMEFQLGRMNKI